MTSKTRRTAILTIVIVAVFSVGICGTVLTREHISLAEAQHRIDLLSYEGREHELSRLYNDIEKAKKGWRAKDTIINGIGVQVQIIGLMEQRDIFGSHK